ncbi:MAG TPA: hypothetical protein PK079_18525 [Leptospiraceae bacterium]|nr:hypothetical protein [Leptospiraceae bacterium]HMW07780.1 hypothetical protein [Leptospiraceae bacterium]HMX35203.1 hypothetical protein [Leptospiraceae bacterium]HMY34277.1 hypothetical protein [Leptospiraceae bacterium]HMZ64077.1 hypothetical protein [Leptospiraceae bacterium]
MKKQLPDNLKKKLKNEEDKNWSDQQINFILETHNAKIVEITGYKPHADYINKTWEFGKARPEYREICESCQFPYAFYAEPRNWSMGSDSDVWNLMKCANVDCGKYFESCL